MPSCCADGCNNSSEKGYQMLKFPDDPLMREQWITMVDIEGWSPTESSVLCEAHFVYDMWQKRKDGSRVLKWNAIPTLFYYEEPPDEEKANEESEDSDVIVDLELSCVDETEYLRLSKSFDLDIYESHSASKRKRQVSPKNKLSEASSKKTQHATMARNNTSVTSKKRFKFPQNPGTEQSIIRQPVLTASSSPSVKSKASRRPILLSPLVNSIGNQSSTPALNSNQLLGIVGNQNLLALNGGQLLQIGGNQSALAVSSGQLLGVPGNQGSLILSNGQLLSISGSPSGLTLSNGQLVQITESLNTKGKKNTGISPQVIPAYSMVSTPKLVGDKSSTAKLSDPKSATTGTHAPVQNTFIPTVGVASSFPVVSAQIGSNTSGFLVNKPGSKATTSFTQPPSLVTIDTKSNNVTNNNTPTFFVLHSSLNASQLIPLLQQSIKSPHISNVISPPSFQAQKGKKKTQLSTESSFIICLSDDEERVEELMPRATHGNSSDSSHMSSLKKKSSLSVNPENNSVKSSFSRNSNIITMTSASGVQQRLTVYEISESLDSLSEDVRESGAVTCDKKRKNNEFLQLVKNSEKIFVRRRLELQRLGAKEATEPILVDLTNEEDISCNENTQGSMADSILSSSVLNSEEAICCSESKEFYIDVVQNKENKTKPARDTHFNGATSTGEIEICTVSRKSHEIVDIFDNCDSESTSLPDRWCYSNNSSPSTELASSSKCSPGFDEETWRYCRRLRLLAKVNMSLIPSLRIPGICPFCNKPTRYIVHRACYNLKAHLLFKSSDCEICGEESLTYSDFQKHLNLHIGTKHFYCDKCPKSFVDEQAFESHIKLNHESHSEDEWLCKRCNTFFMPVDSFQHNCTVTVNSRNQRKDKRVSSWLRSTGKLRKSCHRTVCPFPVHQSQKCHIQHFQWVSNFYDCYICGLKRMRLPQAICHIHQHHKAKPYQCDECPNSYPVRSILNGHKQKQHVQDTSFNLCEQCGETFVSRERLKWHVDWKHGTPSCCEFCGRVFYSRFELKSHLAHGCDSDDNDHSKSENVCSLNNKLYSNVTIRHRTPCIICKKLVTNLRRHIKMHLRERYFQCSKCSKKFIYLFSLAKHKKYCSLHVEN